MHQTDRQLLVLGIAALGSVAALLVFLYAPLSMSPMARFGVATSDENNQASPAIPDVRGFVDVTSASGVSFEHHQVEILEDIRQVMAPGLGVHDLDGDGRLDLLLIGPAADGGSGLYWNRGGLRFEREQAPLSPSGGAYAMGCAIADYDRDGRADVYLTALGPDRLFRNLGGGRFEECAARAGVDDARWSTGSAFADYDRDGDVDLYVANYVRFDPAVILAGTGVRNDRDEPPAFSPFLFEAEPDALYRNEGDGTFTEVSAQAGIVDHGGKGMGVLFADLDGDGWPDIVVINDVSPDLLFHNRGDGTFEDLSVISGLADPRGGMGVAAADYDGDGRLDIFATHWQDETNVLYRNLSRSSGPAAGLLFEDVTYDLRLAAPSLGATGWGASWADADHDGDQDLLVVNGYTSPSPADSTQCIAQRPMLFIRELGGFEDRAAQLGLDDLGKWAGRGAAWADLDADGDLDIVVATNHGPVRIMENRMARGHWLQVQPRAALVAGTVVRISGAGLPAQQRVLLAGSSYLCAEPPVAHFGLGPVQTVEQVEVQFPSGGVVVLQDVAADQILVVDLPE